MTTGCGRSGPSRHDETQPASVLLGGADSYVILSYRGGTSNIYNAADTKNRGMHRVIASPMHHPIYREYEMPSRKHDVASRP